MDRISTVIYRFGLPVFMVFVLNVFLTFISVAQAQCNQGDGCTKSEAQAAAYAYGTSTLSVRSPSGGPWSVEVLCNGSCPTSTGVYFCRHVGKSSYVACGNGAPPPTRSSWYYEKSGCDPGDWHNPLNVTECLNPQKCLQRNQNPGIKDAPPTTRTEGNNCVAGCDFRVVGMKVSWVAGGETFANGHWEYTGDPCGAGQPPKPREKEQDDGQPNCAPVGTQTACLRDDGRMCYQSTRTGNYICWTPGETGNKSDGSNYQERKPGSNPPDESKSLPNGDTANKANTSTTTVNVTYGGNVTNITTTQTNYTTSSGADGPNSGAGTTDNKSGGDSGQSDKPGQTGGSSDSCAVAPQCSEPGSIECAQLIQAWKNHCAWNKPYDGPDPIRPIEDIVESNGEFVEDAPDPVSSLNELSEGWAGRGTCPMVNTPSFTVFGKTFGFADSSVSCEFLDAFASLVIWIAYIQAILIISRGYFWSSK